MVTQLLNNEILKKHFSNAVDLLKLLIQIPSLSKEENHTAEAILHYLESHGVKCYRKGNNIIASNKKYNKNKSTLLLCSHHDTVKPNNGYSRDPFKAIIEDGKLFGLGSNDAGGCLVSLIEAFLYYYESDIPYNLVLAIVAEEEISGKEGVSIVLDEVKSINLGIVGEPTSMKMAIAEKGLIVLDCYSDGISGHAAREEGSNAIYHALQDIEWFRNYSFPIQSELLGPVKMTVTMINAGYQHNVIPDKCHFVVDVRTTDAYTNAETLKIIQSNVRSSISPRSLRLNSSGHNNNTILISAARELGIEMFGSPTLSDQSLMNFPTCKIGPGDSSRSHSADEYILLEEIQSGIIGYIQLLEKIINNKNDETLE